MEGELIIEYKAMAIPKDIFVKNPALLLKDESQVFDALSYLKVFANAISSKEAKIAPSKLEKVVDVVNTQARIVGYSTFIGYLCTSLAKEITSSSSLRPVVLNDTNTLIFGALYGLASIQNSYQLAQDQNLSDLLKEDDALALKGLIQNIPISTRLNQLKASWEALDPKKQKLKKQHFKKKIQKLALDGLKNTQIQSSDLDELLKILQEQEGSDEVHQLLGLTNKDYWKFTPLEALVLLIDQHELNTRRWVQLREASSLPVAQAVDKAYRRGLLERVNHKEDPLVQKNAETEMQKLIGRVRVENTKTKKIHTALLFINLLGAVLSVVGLLTLPFGIGIVVSALSLLITIASIGSKAYLAKKDLLDTPCGKYDKAMVITIATLLGISLIALTGITLGFGLSLVQLAGALTIGALGGGFLGYYYHLLTQKDSLWKQAHPSLEIFQEFLSKKKQWDQEVHDLFKKLPKDLRIAIRQQYTQKDLPSNLSLGNKISALKKTSKYFWNQWLISGSEEDRKLALEIQNVYEEAKNTNPLIKEIKKGSEQQKKILETHLKKVLENSQVKDQYEKDLKYVFYRKNTINNLRRDLSHIPEVSGIVSQKILAESLPSKRCLAQNG